MATKPNDTPKFKNLSKEQKVAAVRAAMEAGHSNASAAEALGTTAGTVAGIRFKNGIPSKNRPGFNPKESGPVEPKPPPPVAPAPVPKPAKSTPPPPAPRPQAPPEPPDKPKPPYKLAVSRFTACDAKWEDDRLCDYEREEGEHFCRLHLWMRKHPRT